MRKRLQAGESAMEGILILAVLLVIIITMPKNSPSNPGNGTTITSDGSTNSATITSTSQPQYVTISPGNAAYSYQPYEEYITLDNYGTNPVNITNWQLRNGKDKRPYYLGGMLQRFSADVAVIPQAAMVLSPSGQNVFVDIVLKQSEQAVITSGSIGVNTPYKIVSFKENSCTGYLERLSDYAFNPPLSQNCPQPNKEPGLSSLPPACRDIISGISSCQTPEFSSQDFDRKPCDNCLNSKSVPSYCATFIKEHYSYKGCIANHINDQDFSGRTWRIFLGRGWEMWAKDYETIELFNSSGQLVSFINY